MSSSRGPLSKLYNGIIGAVDKVVPQFARPLWESPAGPKTVFFWGPIGKWALVLAGIGDLVNRPPQNVSLNQSGVLALTGVLWSRYSVVITPKNYSLLAVNMNLRSIYQGVINTVDPFVPGAVRPLWESPAGPKTVFFWAPLGKWMLVLAGLGDVINRPPELVSLNQAGTLAATGLIWSRYSVVITPKNYSLFAVNIVVFLTQAFLAVKHLRWRSRNSGSLVYYHKRKRE